eukprot:3435504-Prymnesium_polylepis.1
MWSAAEGERVSVSSSDASMLVQAFCSAEAESMTTYVHSLYDTPRDVDLVWASSFGAAAAGELQRLQWVGASPEDGAPAITGGVPRTLAISARETALLRFTGASVRSACASTAGGLERRGREDVPPQRDDHAARLRPVGHFRLRYPQHRRGRAARAPAPRPRGADRELRRRPCCDGGHARGERGRHEGARRCGGHARRWARKAARRTQGPELHGVGRGADRRPPARVGARWQGERRRQQRHDDAAHHDQHGVAGR